MYYSTRLETYPHKHAPLDTTGQRGVSFRVMAESNPGTFESLGDGWARFSSDELPGDALIRFAERDDPPRRVVVTVIIDAGDEGTVDANTLRKLPLGRVEALAN